MLIYICPSKFNCKNLCAKCDPNTLPNNNNLSVIFISTYAII